MGKIVTFGEIMLRLSPQGYNRFMQNDQMQAIFGGGEANVAVSLANFGEEVFYITKLPNNPIADGAVRELRSFGIDTRKIVRGGSRIGIYFLEKGASQRSSVCVYDRANSSISEANSSDFDWNNIFENVDWFHFTGITPALSDNLANICLEACKVAKAKGITISCDLNYRSKLWSKSKACEVMTKVCEYVDICIANESDANDVFGIKANSSDVEKGILNHGSYEQVAFQLKEMFNFKMVAITLRASISASVNKWAGMLYDGDNFYFSKEYLINIVDRVGGGDSFGAGLIYSIINKKSPQEIIEFATASSALKHSIEGDFNLVSLKEVENLLSNGGSGRILR